MIVEEELEQLRQEKKSLQVALEASQAVNQRLRTNNQALREGLQEAIKAIEDLRQRETSLEGVIASQQERLRILEGRLAKDSHNSSLPPSSDWIKRPIKSLRQKSGKTFLSNTWGVLRNSGELRTGSSASPSLVSMEHPRFQCLEPSPAI
jgi:chromosome segregation ATPase